MLRVSKITDYGTVIMAYLAGHPEQVFAAVDIANATGLPQPTVSKVLKLLTKGGLLNSTRGAGGGYGLSRPAEDISVANIVTILEGPIAATECSAGPGLCAQESTCGIQGSWQKINHRIQHTLDRMSLAELIAPSPLSIHVEIH